MFKFENILGNEILVGGLKKAVKQNRVSHAYIFQGDSGFGKKTLVNTFAKFLQCENNEEISDCCDNCKSCITFESGNNPDVFYIYPEKTGKLGVLDVRSQITSEVLIKPYSNKYKIFVVENADEMTVQAQNALLKTMEEPPSYAVFLFLATNINNFLPTILSRSIIVNLLPLGTTIIKKYLMKNFDATMEDINVASVYSGGSLGLAIKILEDSEFKTLRTQLTQLIISIKKSDLVETLKKLSFFEENKEKINIILNMILLLYRDFFILKITNDKEYLIAQDNHVLFSETIKDYTLETLVSKIGIVNKTSENLRKNGNFSMSMENLLLKLKEI